MTAWLLGRYEGYRTFHTVIELLLPRESKQEIEHLMDKMERVTCLHASFALHFAVLKVFFVPCCFRRTDNISNGRKEQKDVEKFYEHALRSAAGLSLERYNALCLLSDDNQI